MRPAVETDALKIHALIRQVGINPTGLEWRRFVVAEAQDGTFIGCGQLKPHGDGSIELASLAVVESYRGQGVARAIVEHLLAKSSRPVYLMCRPELETFYTRFGFRVSGLDELPAYYRRIRRLVRAMGFLIGREGPLIMRLD
ncbi:MAG: GNAT family N-acetyltransferase [Methanoregulaceae archaeon]|nr:GNAT family N-acetyltransferase [Methanoregulaceae archaeon]